MCVWIIYIYIYIYICVDYIDTTCPPGHHHDGFMATGALGHTSVHLSKY